MKNVIAIAASIAIHAAALNSLGWTPQRPDPAGSVEITELDALLAPDLKVAAAYELR